jgi:hypothetical protein
MKSKVTGVLKKTKDPLYGCPLYGGWRIKILTHLVNRKQNIWPCQSEILKSANNALIFSCIIRTKCFPLALTVSQWRIEG